MTELALSWQVVSDGTFALDGGAMFGIVPRPLWEKALPPDARNRVRLGLNCLLVRSADHVVLVETGTGDKGDDLFRSRHAIIRDGGLAGALERVGLTVESVTDVVNSHLHWDHAGGNTRRAPGGRIEPSFPRATYYVQRGELGFARTANPRTRGSYSSEDFEPLLDAGRLVLLDGEAEIAPGVMVHPAAGHLPHMQVVTVQANDETVLFPADLVPTAHHLTPAWTMGYDVEPLIAVASKEHWLEKAAAKRWKIVFYHDSDCPVGVVEEKDGRWAARPAAARRGG